MPRVSVIIPAYNRAGTIRETLESVVAQSFTDYEVIVVDDASRDGTVQIVETFKSLKRSIPLKIVQMDTNSGSAAARNAGIKAARGDYIAFLDSDDLWRPDKLAVQIEALQSGEFDAVHTDSSVMDEDGNLTKESSNAFRQSKNGMVFDENFSDYLGVVNLSSLMIRRRCLEHVGLFDESFLMAEGYEFTLRLFWHCRVRFISRPLVSYRIAATSKSRKNLNEIIRFREAALHKCIDSHPEYFAEHSTLLAEKKKSFALQSGLILFRDGQYSASRRYLGRCLLSSNKARFYYVLSSLPSFVIRWARAVKADLH